WAADKNDVNGTIITTALDALFSTGRLPHTNWIFDIMGGAGISYYNGFTNSELFLQMNTGFSLRYSLSRHFDIRLDLREVLEANSGFNNINNYTQLTLGFTFGL
ncbi:MAG: hypothetical protein JEY91_18085, partial [Spirochaetaceae bacterium]|nr:hypothetical protein [Spirochaetaceae bacterium]